MPVNYNIVADVIDITADTPKAADTFYVDTNVWYWLTYSKASASARPHQINDYPNFITTAKSQKSKLLYSGLTLPELSHVIERTEYDIFNSVTPIKPKEYRHNYPAERQNVVSEITLAWSQIQTIGIFVETRVTDDFTKEAFGRLTKQLLDGYDALIVETLDRSGIKQLVTDDGDFATIPGIQVFTSNRNVLAQAAKQGRLLTR
jgi:predicted nucleic acid-binding protein